MAVEDLLVAYKAQVTTEVSQETMLNSLDPDKIGSIGTDLADILIEELPKINNFPISGGTAFPLGGSDTQLYFRAIAEGIQILRNIDGTWTEMGIIPIGFEIPDGIIVGLRTSINGEAVNVTPGAWSIAGDRSSKDTITGFTLEPKDASFDRWDLIYANTNDEVLILTGDPLLVPVKPDVPGGTIPVDYIYVPAVGTPFILGGQTINSLSSEPFVALASEQTDGIFTMLWNAAKVEQFGTYGRFLIEQENTYQQIPITIIKDISTNKPTAYEFNLSGIDSLIHVI